jgi:hypothetical protein
LEVGILMTLDLSVMSYKGAIKSPVGWILRIVAKDDKAKR